MQKILAIIFLLTSCTSVFAQTINRNKKGELVSITNDTGKDLHTDDLSDIPINDEVRNSRTIETGMYRHKSFVIENGATVFFHARYTSKNNQDLLKTGYYILVEAKEREEVEGILVRRKYEYDIYTEAYTCSALESIKNISEQTISVEDFSRIKLDLHNKHYREIPAISLFRNSNISYLKSGETLHVDRSNFSLRSVESEPISGVKVYRNENNILWFISNERNNPLSFSELSIIPVDPLNPLITADLLVTEAIENKRQGLVDSTEYREDLMELKPGETVEYLPNGRIRAIFTGDIEGPGQKIKGFSSFDGKLLYEEYIDNKGRKVRVDYMPNNVKVSKTLYIDNNNIRHKEIKLEIPDNKAINYKQGSNIKIVEVSVDFFIYRQESYIGDVNGLVIINSGGQTELKTVRSDVMTKDEVFQRELLLSNYFLTVNSNRSEELDIIFEERKRIKQTQIPKINIKKPEKAKASSETTGPDVRGFAEAVTDGPVSIPSRVKSMRVEAGEFLAGKAKRREEVKDRKDRERK